MTQSASWLAFAALLVAAVHLTTTGSALAQETYTVSTFSEAAGLAGLAFETSALGSKGQIFYTDHVSHVIRSVDLATGEVAIVAGVEGTSGHQDGELSTALLSQPRGACISPCDGHLYFVDGDGALLRQLNFQQRTVLTLAGSPAKGFHDGAGNAARFSVARAPVCLVNGSIVVADTSNHPVIRTVHPPAGTQCTLPPPPRPAPGPSRGTSSADMLVHKLVLVGASSVLAIIAAYMFIKVHGGAWLRDRIQTIREQHAGPRRDSQPSVEHLSDEEQGDSLRDSLLLLPAAPAPDAEPLISISPDIPSSPVFASIPSAPAAALPNSAPTPQQPAPTSTAGSRTSSSHMAPTTASPPAHKQDPFPPAGSLPDLI